MIEKTDLFQIKKDIENCIGEKIQLKANKGRKKSFIKEGILENTYPNIFVVKFENAYENTRRVSYSYTDILTKAVEIVVCKDNRKIQVCWYTATIVADIKSIWIPRKKQNKTTWKNIQVVLFCFLVSSNSNNSDTLSIYIT